MRSTRTAIGASALAGIALLATTTGPAQAADDPLAPPDGAKTLQAPTTVKGVQYARYSIRSMTAQQVVQFYQKQLRAAGYQTVNEGGGGSGWSQGWGGGGGGLTAVDNGVYASVNAGGGGRTVYFEVCSGANSKAVNNCQDQSENAQDSNTGGS